MFDNLIKRIISKPKLVLLISVLLLIPSAIGFFLTDVNYNILSYLPEEIDSIQGEQLLDENFGCASMSFLILENMPTDDIKELTQKIDSIECVSSVLGVNEVLTQGIPFEMFPEEIRNILYSSDGNSTIVLIKFSTASADRETMEAINEINSMAKKGCYLSGLSAILTDTKNLVEKQAPLYIIVAIFSALAMLALLSESWIMPPIVLYTLCSAVAVNMGTNIVFGEISYLTECIAVVLQLAVTMDYSVFLVERYHEELLRGYDKEEALFNAVKQSFSSLVGSALTTVFGFAALCFMSLSLGLDIGLVMIKGVIFGLVAVFTVLPALLVLFDDVDAKYTHKFLKPDFTRINVFLIKKRNIFSILFVLLMIPAFLLNSAVGEYYSLDEMLGSSRESIIALNKLKKDFNMASVDFAIVSDELSDADMTAMTDELKNVEGISFVLTYSSIVGPAIPDSIIPDEILQIVKNNNKQLIMMISEYTAGHDDSNSQINILNSILKAYDPGSYLTGEGPLTKDLVEIANTDFKITTVISIAAVMIIIAICLKSFSLPIILVLAIELAIMINEGLAFITGTKIPFIAPAVIGCVQLGATVDYAILLTNRYRQELANGYNRRKAMLIAANASDYSIFKSVLVFFCATFSVYLISDVDIVKDLCLLLARGSIISGLIIIFLMTPLLVTLQKLVSASTVDFDRKIIRLKENNGHEI